MNRHTSFIKPAVIALLFSATSFAVFSGTALGASTPPTATTGALRSVTPTSAVVTGSVNPNGSTTSWYFEFGQSTSTTYTSRTPANSAGSGNSDVGVSASLSGLSPATSYRYRLIATSSAGRTDGSAGIFNTSAAPVVVTGPASHVGASSATLNGIINSEALLSTWYFQYGTSTNYGLKTAQRSLAGGPNDTNVSVAVSTLAPKTTYHFRLVATSSAGSSDGSDLTFTTGLSVTLNASASTVVYGGMVNLSGSVASGLAGAHVTIMAKRFNQAAFSGEAAVTTGAGGNWSYTAQPSVRSTYEATANGGTSSPVLVSVRPAVFLNLVSGGQLSTRVVGASSFGAHVLQLQRLSHGLWVTWKHVRLNASGRATFATSLPKGQTSIRMAIGPFVPGLDQAAPGYLAGYSRAIVYKH